LSSTLWWQGPAWLRNQVNINNEQTREVKISEDEQEDKPDTIVTLATNYEPNENWINKFSTFS